MKTLLTSVALVATMATGATASNTPDNQWVGIEDSSTLPNKCDFKSNVDGHMDLNTTTGVWTASTPSRITVEYRGVPNKIVVEADNRKSYQKNFSYDATGALVENGNTGNGVIHGHAYGTRHGETFDADVSYVGSKYKNTQDGGTLTTTWKLANDNGGSFEIRSSGPEFAGITEIEIYGTAKPTGIAIYSANENYYVPHKITCVQ